MNKSLLRLLSVSVIALTLSSCSTSSASIERELYTKPATDFSLNTHGVALMNGESFQINARFSPRLAFNSQLTYSSKNEEVVTVDENGLITAVNAGVTSVTAKYVNGEDEISKEFPVYVCNAISDALAKRYGKKQQDYQKSLKLDKLRKQEIRDNFTFLGDDRINGYTDDCDYLLGKSDGFFHVDGYQREIKTTNGSLEDTKYAWIFSTDKDYASTMYHVSGSSKTRLTVPTQSFIGQPRVNAVYSLLDTLFTSGRKIATNIQEDILEATSLERLVGGSYGGSTHGYFKDENYEVQYLRFVGNGRDQVSPDDESNYNIPAYTNYIFEQDVTICWVNGAAKYEYIDQSMYYNAWGNDYVRSTQIEYNHDVDDDVTITYPDKSEFKEVDSIFDL